MGILLNSIPNGSVPITNRDEPLQLVTLKHPEGKYLIPHKHDPKKRSTVFCETCFVVRKGKIKLNLYEPKKNKFFKSIILNQGDIFITLNGSGHGICMLEDSEVLEVKNGPFIEDKILIEAT